MGGWCRGEVGEDMGGMGKRDIIWGPGPDGEWRRAGTGFGPSLAKVGVVGNEAIR